jgi:hypothetical protein
MGPHPHAQARVELEGFMGVDFTETITRARFDELCHALFKRTLAPVETVLKDAGLRKDEVDEIVLVRSAAILTFTPTFTLTRALTLTRTLRTRSTRSSTRSPRTQDRAAACAVCRRCAAACGV